MSTEPERSGNVIKDFCVGLLVASMALWGAVQILASIWVWICIGLAVAGLVFVAWSVVRQRNRW
jgi:hypothetical protein